MGIILLTSSSWSSVVWREGPQQWTPGSWMKWSKDLHCESLTPPNSKKSGCMKCEVAIHKVYIYTDEYRFLFFRSNKRYCSTWIYLHNISWHDLKLIVSLSAFLFFAISGSPPKIWDQDVDRKHAKKRPVHHCESTWFGHFWSCQAGVKAARWLGGME